jgi:uncharacterized membrane protein
VSRKLRIILSPGWILLHLVAIALIVAMVLLGRWQLLVSEHRHFHLQNFGYALQWWLFSLFVVFMWVRLVRDAVRRGSPAAAPSDSSQDAEATTSSADDVPYRRYVMPSAAEPAGDALNAEYNDYLARLGRDTADGSGTERTNQ